MPQPGPPRGAGDNPYSDYKPPVEPESHDEEKLLEHRPGGTVENLTPDERAELANFERSRPLLNSIIAKSPNRAAWAHTSFRMPQSQGLEIDVRSVEAKVERAQDIGKDKSPETIELYVEPLNHPIFDGLTLHMRDLRYYSDMSMDLKTVGFDPVISISLAGESRSLHVGLLANNKLDIYISTKTESKVNGSHDEKMAALNELYDVLSFVVADLPDKPRNDTSPEPESEVE